MVKTFLRSDMIERFLISVGEYQKINNVKFAEVLIGDDSDKSCIDKTRSVIRQLKLKYPELNTNYQCYEFNVGSGEGRNRMINIIKTKYFLYCDDDYILDCNCDIAYVLNQLEHNRCDLISGWLKNYPTDLFTDYHIVNFLGYFILHEDIVTCLVYSNYTPTFCLADYHTNFYIARTDKIKQIKWDSKLKTEEHPEFFLRAFKNKLKMGFTSELFVKHNHLQNNKYEKYRNIDRKGETYLYLRVKRAGFKKWVAIYNENSVITKWVIDCENRVNYKKIYRTSTITKKESKLLTPIYNQRVAIKRLTPEFEHYFFGYYDVQAMNNNETVHLALKIPFMNKLPSQYDKAKICLINEKGDSKIIDETTAWNFQQGAFLQYRPKHIDQVIYNVFDNEDNRHKSIVQDLKTGEKKVLPLPVANVSPNGDKALSINFSRLYNYRPGYGYCNKKDLFHNETSPKNDGIFLIDIDSGKHKLIIPYQKLWDLFVKDTKNENDKMVINHVAFNTDGTRFLMLLRFFSRTAPWPTITITADINGDNICKVFGFGSHYHWKNTTKLLISGANIHDKGEMKSSTLYELEDITSNFKTVDENFFKGDGHCSYSPDRNYILYDSYNSKEFPYKKLQIYDLRKRKGVTLAYLYSDPDLYNGLVDCRCDLHPRWSFNGKYITFDSIHEGFRGIYSINTEEAINEIDKKVKLLSEFKIKKLVAMEYKLGVKNTNNYNIERAIGMKLKNILKVTIKRFLLKFNPIFRRLNNLGNDIEIRLNDMENNIINKLDYTQEIMTKVDNKMVNIECKITNIDGRIKTIEDNIGMINKQS